MNNFKLGDKIRVIKDDENDNFFLGSEGVLVDYDKGDEYPYKIVLDKMPKDFFHFKAKEDEIELIK